jgi:hypothetical protein
MTFSGVNQYCQVISYIFCNGVTAEERVSFTKEIHQRFVKHANMIGSLSLDEEQVSSSASLSSSSVITQAQAHVSGDNGSLASSASSLLSADLDSGEEKWGGPLMFSDKCCDDTQCLKDGGFKDPIVLGDVYHITKRIIDAMNKANWTPYWMCIRDLRMCFGSDELGVFWDGEKIIAKIEALMEIYIPTGAWTSATTAKFEIQKHHILHCLHFPKVKIAMKIFLCILLHYLRYFSIYEVQIEEIYNL